MKRISIMLLFTLNLYAANTIVIQKEIKYEQSKLNEIYSKFYKKNYNIKIDLNQKKATKVGNKTYNEFEMEFIFIKPGVFMMGSTKNSNSQPLHKVKINYSFYISKYEITNKEYVKFLNANIKNFKKSWVDIYSGWNRSKIKKNSKFYVDKEFEKQPAVYVSWEGAKAYTKWLSNINGSFFRLPTEAEWEYVARGNTTTDYFFGNNKQILDQYSWSYTNSGTTIHNVGLLKSNPFGLYDISGNVWEWCEDTYSNSYKNVKNDGSANLLGYKRRSKKNTQNQWMANSNATENETIVTDDKVIRGGSYLNFSSSHTVHYREHDNYLNKSRNVGFRIVKISKDAK